MKNRTYTGRVVGTPTVHHVTAYGNAAKQFVIVAPGMTDAIVAVTAGNASIGYTIGNSTFREVNHVFHFNARGKVTHAETVPTIGDTQKYARDLVVGDRIALATGRVVRVDYVHVSSDGGAVVLGYANEADGVSERRPSQAWNNQYVVVGR